MPRKNASHFEPVDLRTQIQAGGAVEPKGFAAPSLRQPLVMFLSEQHQRDHRRPFDNRLVAMAVRKIVDEEG